MTTKFYGNIAELKIRVAATGIGGSWTFETGAHTFRATTGAILKWWPKTGSISFQGPAIQRSAFRSLVLIALNWPARPASAGKPASTVVDRQKREFLISRAEVVSVEEEIDGD